MNSKKSFAVMIGVSLAAGLGANVASANPFGYSDLASGYNVGGAGSDEVKKPEEGKCGAEKAKPEGKCGGEKAKPEGKCGAEKAKHEGQCGANKATMEGKCGEGKCGAASPKHEHHHPEHTDDKPKS